MVRRYAAFLVNTHIQLGGDTMVLEKIKVILAEQFDVEEDKITVYLQFKELSHILEISSFNRMLFEDCCLFFLYAIVRKYKVLQVKYNLAF